MSYFLDEIPAIVTYSKFKKDIREYPFSSYATVIPSELDSLAKQHDIAKHSSWMIPQMLSLFGQFRVVRDAEGKCSPLKTLQKNIGEDTHLIGIWRVAVKLTRGILVSKQIDEPQHSMLVPLILAGIKRDQGINYSEWSAEGLSNIVHPKLYQALTAEGIPTLNCKRLLEIREIGLTVASGPKKGTVANPTAKWSLTGIGNTELGNLPSLVTTMLTQTWVAHPSLRTDLMVLDPTNWDNVPAPLIASDIFT